MKPVLHSAMVLFSTCIVLLGCAGVEKAIPEKDTGPMADSLAHQIMKATHYDAWQKTGVVGWTFAGKNKHIWDRERGYSLVEWGNTKVIFDHRTMQGKAWEDGNSVSGEKLNSLIQEAYKNWANDSFWLNPFEKLYDPGTERAFVRTEDGNDALLITYTSGGLTPGDSYLWIVDRSGLPIRVRMWVSIIPIKGIGVSWEEWHTLSTGARTAALHRLGFIKLRLTDIKAAATMSEFADEDPFAVL